MINTSRQRLVAAGSAVGILGALVLCPSAQAAPSHSPHFDRTADHKTDLMGMFEDAAYEFAVPVELLLAVSHRAGQWFPEVGEKHHHSSPEVGHMALRLDARGPSVDLAAELLGVDSEAILSDAQLNIRGGAALLAFYAQEATGQHLAGELNDKTAYGWWEATTQYAGIDNAIHSQLFAKQVFHGVETGLEGVSPTTHQWIYSPSTTLPQNIQEWSQAAEASMMAARAKAQQITATDYPDADWVAACSSNYSNYSRNASDIYYVVIHVAEGSYSGTISWFQNCSAGSSSHYVVSKYGEVTQVVREEDVAWHAGHWDTNYASVGIEHEGYTYTASTFTDAMYQGSADLTADICDRNNIPKTRSYIIGHNEVPGCSNPDGGGASCHTDPGPYFDWDYYIDLVNGSTGGGGDDPPTGGTGDLVGIVADTDIYTGARIQGATISLRLGSSTTTDSSGYYAFEDLSAGSYVVTATATGYDSTSQTCTVVANSDNWCSMAMTPSTGGGGGDDETPTGCSGFTDPGSLTDSAAAPFLPPVALALLGGLALRRRRRL